MNSVNQTCPQRQLTSNVLRQALESFIVPPVIEECQVVALRCIFNVKPGNWRSQSEQISARRRQLEMALFNRTEVSPVIA